MKKRLLVLFCIVLFSNHDMYLKMNTYFINTNEKSKILLFNGTFDKSENVIDRDRMIDASFFNNGKRTKIENNQWTERDSTTTVLNFTSDNEGTWVAGVSTKPRNIAMDAEAFNNYLIHDGIKDMLEKRKQDNTLEENAVEKYSKHVKVIFQVGDKKTEDWNKDFGYPIEFIPLENPYKKYTGDNLKVKLLGDGKPLKNQLVYANFKASSHGHSHNNSHVHNNETHTHDNNEEHSHDARQELRTDEKGIIDLKLTNDGIWYLRTIHLVTSEEEGLTHESNWATLTFEVTHNHENSDHSHNHDDEGLPSYTFWIISILVVLVLFFFFNRKK